MAIQALPSIAGLLTLTRERSYPFPLDGKDGVACFNGRAAIWQGIKRLGLSSGDRVLMPAYCCGSEFDALIMSGLDVCLYRLTPSLQPDLDHIESLLDRTTRPKVLYLIHYFGFSQPMDDLLSFARRHRLIVVEDCAQALYSHDAEGRPLGSRGDLGVFSLMKSLPLPDGGAYIMNNDRSEAAFAVRSVAPDPLAVLGKIKHLTQEASRARYPETTEKIDRRIIAPAVALAKRLTGRQPKAARPSANAEFDPMAIIALDPVRGDWRMSPVARWLMRQAKHSDIPRRRRENFAALAAAIEPTPAIRPLCPELTSGCSPLNFPIYVEESTALHRHLLAADIHCHRIWSYFHDAMAMEEFPFESGLKRNVLALPVHQDLGIEDMRRIAEVVNGWSSQYSVQSLKSAVSG